MKKYYLCGITFRYELGETDMAGCIHESLEDLKLKHTCWEECGVVEVDGEEGQEPKTSDPHRWVIPEDLDWRKYQKADLDIEKVERAEVPGTGKTMDELRREDEDES